MLQSLKNKCQAYGVDRILAVNAASKVWVILSGPIILAIIVSKLSVAQQGFHFTFLSLIGLSVFLDMGFTRAIIVFTSHEFGALKLRRGSTMEGDVEGRQSIADFCKSVILAHILLAVLAAIVIGMIGEAFFVSTASEENWRSAWWSVTIAASLSFIVCPLQMILQGAGQVMQVAKIRLAAQVAGNIALASALLLGGELHSAACSAWAANLISLMLVAALYMPFWREIWTGKVRRGIRSIRKLLPYQARVAVSWAAGYLVFSAMTPIAFATLGPDEAARMGLTWQLIGIVGGLGLSIIQAKTPLFGSLISKGNHLEARNAARNATRGAIWVGALGLTALIAVVATVRMLDAVAWPLVLNEAIDRMLPLASICVLAIAEIAKLKVLGRVALVRTYKVEPFVFMFTGLAVLILSLCWALSSALGVAWLCIGYAVGQIIAIPWSGYHQKRHLQSIECPTVS